MAPMSSKTVAIAADHGGFSLKSALVHRLEAHGIDVLDLGTDSEESVDYPDYAAPVVDAVASGRAERGVLVCGSGIGMSIAANRHPKIRAALVYETEGATLCREHNDANVLCLGARMISEDVAGRCLDLFLDTDFEGGRHARRVEKLGGVATEPAE